MSHSQVDLGKPLQQCNGIFFVFFPQTTDLN